MKFAFSDTASAVATRLQMRAKNTMLTMTARYSAVSNVFASTIT